MMPNKAPRNTISRRVRAMVVILMTTTLVAGGTAVWSFARAETAPAPLEIAKSTVAKPAGFAALVKKVKHAVVNISTTAVVSDGPAFQLPQFPGLPPGPWGNQLRKYFKEQFGNQGGSHETQALGSGFIIDPAGYIVTNNHVIENATKIVVKLDNGQSYPAEIKGRDKKSDLALLKIDVGHPLPYVEFGDSDQAQVGDWVIAVGNPYGLGGTVTAGIISARGRELDNNPYDDYLQVDAPINPGNSGGPLFDQSGHVIGIDTAIYTPNGGNVGIGFAIPSKTVASVINQLREHGKVKRGWLGIAMQPVTPALAKALGMNKAEGVIIASVIPDSPASRAKLHHGDVLISINGTTIRKPRDLAIAVANMQAGSKATFKVLYKGKLREVTATISHRAARDKMAENGKTKASSGHLGLTLGPLTDDSRNQLGLDKSVKGALVTSVAPGSAAEKIGIQPGDVIVNVGYNTVTSPAEAVADIHDAEAHKKEGVALLVNRGGKTYYLALPLKKA